jgi:hypothetical protein
MAALMPNQRRRYAMAFECDRLNPIQDYDAARQPYRRPASAHVGRTENDVALRLSRAGVRLAAELNNALNRRVTKPWI